MVQKNMRERNDETPLSDHLLEHFATWYVLCVFAIRALEKARASHKVVQK